MPGQKMAPERKLWNRKWRSWNEWCFIVVSHRYRVDFHSLSLCLWVSQQPRCSGLKAIMRLVLICHLTHRLFVL